MDPQWHLLEHMGVKVLEQLEYTVEPEGSPPVYLHDFGMSHAGDTKLDVSQVKSGFEEAFARAWRSEIENDDFNRPGAAGKSRLAPSHDFAGLQQILAADRVYFQPSDKTFQVIRWHRFLCGD